ncbi:Tyrosine-protein phosphatase non-receptor type 9 [Aphelenchoides besseyi]|nr:Tyrosine-protein phosphatase non-receptor type 9 [Aphelenchoides besseyi]
MNVANLSIQNTGVEIVGKDLKYTKLIVSGIGSDGGVRKHTVNHVLWSEWPDKISAIRIRVPLTSTGALRLIFRTQTFSPSVVHCSAGVGRTGTIVALECCMRVLNAGNELSVYNVVKILRSQRFLACQTDLQYLYVHRYVPSDYYNTTPGLRSILAFITSKNILPVETVSNFVTDYGTVFT